MPIIDPDNGIIDYEAEPGDEADYSYELSLADQMTAEARKALFEKQQVTVNGKTRRATRLQLYYDALTMAVGKGDANAIEELDRIAQHQQRQRQLAEVGRNYRSSPVRLLEAKHARVMAAPRVVGALIVIRLAPEIIAAFEKVYGPIEISERISPYYLDTKPVVAAILKGRRRRKKREPKKDYKVGYGKPASQTLFTSDNNPRNKSRSVNVLEKLIKSGNKPIAVTSDGGKKVKMTRLAIGMRRAINDAIRGIKPARQKVRKLIIRLDEQGQLAPSQTTRRPPVAIDPAQATQMRMLAQVFEVKFVATIKQDMIAKLSRRYGPVPDFVTSYERSLPSSVDDVEGWLEFQAKRNAAKAEERAAQQRAEEVSLAIESPIALPYPTRTRTRLPDPPR